MVASPATSLGGDVATPQPPRPRCWPGASGLRRLGKALVLLLGLGVARGGEAAEAGANTNLSTLTTARQVLDLSRGEAARAHPVSITGAVTCFDARTALFFVQDQTAGIYVYADQREYSLRPGQVVEIQGVSAAGRFTPIVHLYQWRATGQSSNVVAKPVTLEQLAGGQEDSQWVVVEGIVRAEAEDWGHLVLDLAADGQLLKARVLTFPKPREGDLAEAHVRVRGVAATHYNAKGQLTGFHLIVPNYADIQPLTPPAADPFGQPRQHIRDVLSYGSRREHGRRVRIEGVVTFSRTARAIVVRDPTGGLVVHPHEPCAAKVGDRVTVVGFPVPGGYTPVLEHASLKVLGPGRVPPPKPTTVAEALGGNLDNELVQLEGRLEEQAAEGDAELALVLRAGERVFRALAPRPAGAWPPGARLRLTGVCSVLVDEASKPKTFQLLLRSAADVQVLSLHPWWTGPRLMWATGISGGLLLAGWLWMGLLRRRVRAETIGLREREARLEETLRQRETELRCSLEARARLARDLHDGIIQAIYGVGLGLETCQRQLADDPAQARAGLQHATAQLNAVIRDVRNFILGLEPESLKHHDLEEALEELTRSLTGGFAGNVSLEVEPRAAGRLTSHQTAQLVLVAREALSNALRHAQARNITLALRAGKDGVRFEVRDDGRGYETAAPPEAGCGLRNMAARAQDLNARLDIVSRPAYGTAVVLEIPTPSAPHG